MSVDCAVDSLDFAVSVEDTDSFVVGSVVDPCVLSVIFIVDSAVVSVISFDDSVLDSVGVTVDSVFDCCFCSVVNWLVVVGVVVGWPVVDAI